RLRTKNLSVPLNQSDLNENERGEGEPGEETAMVPSTVVETSEGGETTFTIYKSDDPETYRAHARLYLNSISTDSVPQHETDSNEE
ncbi:hypothetical protein HID58_002172, partial [Brassica napus]